jgi:predicted ATP-binding protein involved in virulence
MKIKSLELSSFRCFNKLCIDFDERLTILVGINGSGKTAILDALASILRPIADYFSTKKIENPQLKITDIPINKSEIGLQVILEADIADNKLNFETVFAKTKLNDIHLPLINIYTTYFENMTRELYHNVINSSLIYGLPILIYYMSKRIVPEKYSIIDQNLSINYLTAYQNAFSPEIDFQNSLSWFAAQDAHEARIVRDKDSNYRMPELEAVRQAIVKALGDYESPSIYESELIVFKKETKEAHTLTQLSDGYRTMLALIMDLARRMAVANKHVTWKDNKTALHSPAIVLIDEIELHLHPSWQQTVLPGLMEIFPNTQFIVTTHSPQVLTSIDSRYIRILQDGEAYTFEEPTEGAESSHLLERVLGVDPRPQNLEPVRKLKEYEKLVYAEKWDSPEAIRLQEDLEAHFGADDLKMTALALHVKNSKWERGL